MIARFFRKLIICVYFSPPEAALITTQKAWRGPHRIGGQGEKSFSSFIMRGELQTDFK